MYVFMTGDNSGCYQMDYFLENIFSTPTTKPRLYSHSIIIPTNEHI